MLAKTNLVTFVYKIMSLILPFNALNQEASYFFNVDAKYLTPLRGGEITQQGFEPGRSALNGKRGLTGKDNVRCRLCQLIARGCWSENLDNPDHRDGHDRICAYLATLCAIVILWQPKRESSSILRSQGVLTGASDF